MSKFKVGDMVTVRTLVEIREWECRHGVQVPWSFPSEMAQYCGMTFVIHSVEYDTWEDMQGMQSQYRLVGVGYSWSDPMLDYADYNL